MRFYRLKLVYTLASTGFAGAFDCRFIFSISINVLTRLPAHEHKEHDAKTDSNSQCNDRDDKLSTSRPDKGQQDERRHSNKHNDSEDGSTQLRTDHG
jgi:hypothetical protein